MRTYDPNSHEPNKSAPHAGQDEGTINGLTFRVDRHMKRVIEALNHAGLQTYSHCEGHGPDHAAWLVLELDDVNVEIRPKEGRHQLVLTWVPPWAKEDWLEPVKPRAEVFVSPGTPWLK